MALLVKGLQETQTIQVRQLLFEVQATNRQGTDYSHLYIEISKDDGNIYASNIGSQRKIIGILGQLFARDNFKFLSKTPSILGASNAVQIDEGLFGVRRKYNRGNHLRHTKSWVFGIVERATNPCVLWAVQRRNIITLTNFIKDHVPPKATIKNEEWAA